MTGLRIEKATAHEVPLIVRFIRELAEYEKMLHGVTATEESLRETLFGPGPASSAVTTASPSMRMKNRSASQSTSSTIQVLLTGGDCIWKTCMSVPRHAEMEQGGSC